MTKHHCMVEQTVECQSIFNAHLVPLNLSNITNIMPISFGSTPEAKDEMETWHVAQLICTSVLVRHLWNSVIYWISTSNMSHVTYGVVSKSRYFTMFRNHSRISREPCIVYTFSTATQSQELISSANTNCLDLHLNLKKNYAQICR